MIRTFAISLVIFMTACGAVPVLQPSKTVAVSAGSTPLAATNAQRAANGRSQLRRSAQLDQMARAHGEDLQRNNQFSHRGSDGTGLAVRANRVGYRYCFIGENIAKGQLSLSSAIAGWMTSPGHRRNLLDYRAKELGFAQVGDIWVMVLGASNC